MSAKVPSLPLPSLAGGINRYDAEAGLEQVVDGLDVWERDGELARRPAFYVRAVGQWSDLPVPYTLLVVGPFADPTVYNDRKTTISAGVEEIFIGCKEKFHGFKWPWVTPGTTTAPRRIQVQLRSGDWTDPVAAFDTTWTHSANGPHTLTQSGTVTWHKDSNTYADWNAEDLFSIGEDLYWIRVAFVWAGSELATAAGNIVMEEPGVTCLKLRPVDTIIPSRTRSGPSRVLAGGSKSWRYHEPGAGLGLLGPRGANRPLLVKEDEGSGVIGNISVVQKVWTETPGDGFYTGTPTEVADDTFSRGVADNLTKFDDRYEWFDGQFKGGPIYGQVRSTHTSYATDATVDIFQLPLITTNTPLNDAKADELKGCILRVTTSGGGPAVNERCVILENTAPTAGSTTIIAHPQLSVAPTATTEFEIVPFEFRAHLATGSLEQYVCNIHSSVDPGDRVLLAQTGFDPEVRTADQTQGLFQIGTRTADKIRPGRWSSTWDPTTKELYLTNGRSGVLAFDGTILRNVAALADPDNARVQQWLGTLPDQAREELSTRNIAGSQLLGRVPQGKYVQEFWGRIVVAGIDSDPYGVAWSAPAPDNDLWPSLYRTQVRDDLNNEITGMVVLGDRIFVFTPTSVFGAGVPGEDGLLRFSPVSRGLGFLSHFGVVTINNNTALGITADGIYSFNGYEPAPLLDEWDRLIEGGVNKSRLSNAVAGVSLFQNLVFFAVPSQGRSTNDRLVIFDYEASRFWVWSAPFGGISSIARDFDEFGNERMLFGHEDGHVTVLAEGATDDGEETITGRAKSKLIPLTNNFLTTFPQKLALQLHETGESVTVRTYPNGLLGATAETKDWNNPNSPQDIYGTGLYGTATWAGFALYVNEVRCDSNERCQSMAFELEGSGQWRYRGGALFLPPRTASDRG